MRENFLSSKAVVDWRSQKIFTEKTSNMHTTRSKSFFVNLQARSLTQAGIHDRYFPVNFALHFRKVYL